MIGLPIGRSEMANNIERMTVVFPEPMAKAIREAVEDGQYASTSEVVREAVRDWTRKRWLEDPELIDRLRRSVAQARESGPAVPFDGEAIIKRARAKRDAGLKGRD
jgi:antitoxin ParD1/3/4